MSQNKVKKKERKVEIPVNNKHFKGYTLRNEIAMDVGMDVGKEESLFTIGKNANWYISYGNQYADVSKN